MQTISWETLQVEPQVGLLHTSTGGPQSPLHHCSPAFSKPELPEATELMRQGINYIACGKSKACSPVSSSIPPAQVYPSASKLAGSPGLAPFRAIRHWCSRTCVPEQTSAVKICVVDIIFTCDQTSVNTAAAAQIPETLSAVLQLLPHRQPCPTFLPVDSPPHRCSRAGGVQAYPVRAGDL